MNQTIKVTPQQRENALEALNVMWPSVPPENVYPSLLAWRNSPYREAPHCGTLACFGGWSEWWPPFRAQLGLNPGEGTSSWPRLARLFGPPGHKHIDWLFNATGGHPADRGFEGTDHELVSNRLRRLIANSEVML